MGGQIMSLAEYIIGVDSGCIWVGDPCYTMGTDAGHGLTRDKIGQAIIDDDHGGVSPGPLGVAMGMAVATRADGAFRVEVESDEQGPKTITIHIREDADA